MSQRFFLFVRRKKPTREQSEGVYFMPFLRMEMENWKNSSLECEDKVPSYLEFVCEVGDPKHVADHVRKAPLEQYVLFRGEAIELQVAIPVFAQGKSLDTLSKEWGNE